MDQVKEILRQAIKYRFWIAVGVSCLLPMIAYFVGVGPIQTKAAAETALITSAEKDVKQYTGGKPVNGQYKGVVAEKTEVLTNDVNVSWKKLYARQAPLLTWPERVQDRFTIWGRKWPENVDSSAVQFAIIDYINAYPAFVTEVYKSFKPFDFAEGTGVVNAPPEAALLRPAEFKIEAPPTLGKVWATQERLWVQRTLLDVIAQVNKDAKTWDGAIIKQIEALEVGSPSAQDQRSIAKGDTLEEALAIDDPAKPAVETSEAAGAEGGMSSMMSMMGPRGGGAAGAAPETVSYIKSATENAPYKVMPVQLTVLIDQGHIQDLLVALENSPMTIQVMDFEMAKSSSPVKKPEKGQPTGYGMMGMMGGGDSSMNMMAMMMGRGGMRGYGGRTPDMMSNMSSMMMNMGGMGGTTPAKKGVDARSKNREAEAKKREEDATKAVQNSLHDLYHYVVQVKITGQARFFNPPPAGEEAAPSQAEGASTAEGDAAKKDDAPKTEGAAAEPKDDATKKEDEKKDDAKAPDDAAKKSADAPKAGAESKDAAKKDDAPKAKTEGDASKKTDGPKDDASDATSKK